MHSDPDQNNYGINRKNKSSRLFDISYFSYKENARGQHKAKILESNHLFCHCDFLKDWLIELLLFFLVL